MLIGEQMSQSGPSLFSHSCKLADSAADFDYYCCSFLSFCFRVHAMQCEAGQVQEAGVQQLPSFNARKRVITKMTVMGL
jgi:hypothetical protein